ncbi:calcineurin-like phosphoesterase family protein [Rhodobacter aestuarii]|uniref:Calcineurin-like phosphoesterase n=1 Tax=Rhodobacter aestuarii TaxID=453582 RepID=A0A1N7QGE9_9RHOB|nr:metallophosphoesterase [Rhodobacter aestuarii]PTV93492.1 calcineurin-like phosphoesterase family protein [Rhodobacter aestuarii]SIT21577.1 Calcineurin-like phosphoesterase [Rhodobacter aestuarii]
MPKILILADLHYDFWQEAGRNPLAKADFSEIDLLVIAGDLSNKAQVRWKPALAAISHHIDLSKVCIFPGNHDFYDGRLDREDKLEAIARGVGAHFVQIQEIILGDIRLLCCTLWTDMMLGGNRERNGAEAMERMNDYRCIRVEREHYRKLRPHHTTDVHAHHLAWLDERLSAPFYGRTIVVTHHAPHPSSLAPDGAVRAAYASDLTALIARHQPDYWFFGHTHREASFRIERTQLINVSVGYPNDWASAPRLDASWRGCVW